MSDQKKKSRLVSADAPKNTETVVLTVTDLNNLGCGVGRLPASPEENMVNATGMVVFVRGTVTGDVVEAQIIKRTASYLVGRLVHIVTPSPLRTEEIFCTAPEACGGCVYRHLAYQHELASKHQRVIRAFRQAGLSDVAVRAPLSTNVIKGYRNKGMYPVRQSKNGMEAGFFAAKSHKLIPATDCSLQPAVFGKIVRCVCTFCDARRIMAYDEMTGKGVLRHIYLRTASDGAIMVCLVINARTLPGGKPTCDALVDALTKTFPQITSIQLNIHEKQTNVVLGDRFVTLWGADCLEDTLCGLQFRISGGSFYQVNHDAAELLYNTAADMADLRPDDVLWDLYCGAGTIGLSMLSRVRRVVGVEIVDEAVVCARENAEINADLGRIRPDTAHFFCADASDPASLFAPADRGEVPPPNTVVIDPPRKGTTPALIRELSRRDIRRVVYISCDPETLGRDCAVFRECGYEIGEVQPVDLFPRTGHVESVVCLKKS